MRVLFDARKLRDFGIGTYIRGLLPAMCALRPDWPFVLIGSPEQVRDDHEVAFGDNVSWRADRSGKYSLAEIGSLARHARAARADVFHAPHYVYPARLPCPGIVTIHDCIHLRFPQQLPRPLGVLPRRLSHTYAKRMMRHAASSAARVITVSDATRSDVLEMLGAPAESVVTIANGCDSVFAEPTDDRADEIIAEQLRLPERYLLFVGNAKPHKNLRRLIAAFGRLAGAHADLELLLVGKVSDAAERFANLAPEHASRVRDLGFVDTVQLRTLYRRARVLCLPSLHEGFGLPALEAMACGTSVVAGATGGLPELLGTAGLLIDPYDVGAIATAIRRLLEDHALRRRFERAGPLRAGEFTWERAARATVQQYVATRSESKA